MGITNHMPMPMPMPMDIGDADENHGDDMDLDQDIGEPIDDEIVLDKDIQDVLTTICSTVEKDIIGGDQNYTDEVKHKLTKETYTLFTKNPNKHNFYTIISDVLQYIARKDDDEDKYEDEDDEDNNYHYYKNSINIIGNLIFQVWSQYHEREELHELSAEAIEQLALPYIDLTREIFAQL